MHVRKCIHMHVISVCSICICNICLEIRHLTSISNSRKVYWTWYGRTGRGGSVGGSWLWCCSGGCPEWMVKLGMEAGVIVEFYADLDKLVEVLREGDLVA